MVKNENTGNVDMHMILGEHCEFVNVIGQSNDIIVNHDLFKNEEIKVLTDGEKTNRRRKLLSWLQTNMIPITEDGEVLRLKDVLTIYPPYNSNNCMSKNEIILEKIQNLITSMNDCKSKMT